MIDNRFQTKHSLDDHLVVSLTALAKAQIREYFALITPQQPDIAKLLVVFIGCFPAPINDLALGNNQQAQFDAYNPAMIALTFLGNLGVATTISNRMNQLNTVTINHTLSTRFNQHSVGQNLVLFQHSQQPTRLGKFGKRWCQSPLSQR